MSELFSKDFSVLLKKLFSILFLLSFLSGLFLQEASATEVNGHIFLKGTYMELGIAPNGRFGSDQAAPSGYHENAGGLGFVADYQKDGWASGTPNYGGDYFYPGTPYEGFGVEWTVSSTDYSFSNTHDSDQIATTSLSELSSGDNQIAVWEGIATNGSQQLTITQTYWFNVGEAVIHADVEIENTGSVSLGSVEFMRGVDPDNEQPWGNSYDTVNEVVYQPGLEGNLDMAIVTATGTTYTDMSLVLGTVDDRAKGSADEEFSIDTDSVLDEYTLGSISGDNAIGLAYRFGTLSPGDIVEFTYVYGLNLADVDAALGTSLTSAPTAITDSATDINYGSAQLNGTVNPKDDSTIVSFEYGLDTSYGMTVVADQSPVSGPSDVSVTKSISGLSSKTTYHYRVIATNSGGTTNGLDQTFTTDDYNPSVANPITDVEVNEDAPDQVIDLTNVFTDPDDDDSAITKSIYSNTNSGLVSTSLVGNSLTLDFLADQFGSAQITIQGTSNGKTVNDTFMVTVTAVNDPPSITSCDVAPTPAYTDDDLTASYSGWDDPEGDSANVEYAWFVNNTHLSGEDNTTLLPSSQFSHRDTVELECIPVDSEGLSGTTLFDSVVISNSTPDAVDDSDTTVEDNPVTVDVLDNDTDADSGDTLTVTSITQGTNGTVTNNGTDVTYDPDVNYFGSDTFSYTMEDDIGESDTATVLISVTATTDMVVNGNGISIANGDSSPSGTDGTDFGGTPLFLGTVDRTFEVENLGSVDLNLTGSPRVSIGGAHSGDFTVITQPSSPVGSGSSSAFIIQFDPSAAGPRTAEVRIESDDLVDPYTFAVQGTATVHDSDGDGVTDNVEQDGDRDGDGAADYQDYDPTGYFYDQETGEIIPGGSISVSGPGVVTLVEDGSTGYYQFLTDGTAGTYTLTVTVPPGFDLSEACLPSNPPPYDPTGESEPVNLGNGENADTGFLTSNACTTFYLSLDLAAGDPMIINNNIPLERLPLPDTGFPPGQVTELTQQPPHKAYQALSGMRLDIPAIEVSTSLVGVPAAGGDWDVSWLGEQAGYLAGSAFPTWAGNTVITGHVWNADNQPGVFRELRNLAQGDEIRLHAWGMVYTYWVQESRLISSDVPGLVFEHKEGDWVTLFTCEGYAQYLGDYSFRRMVQAQLVEVRPE